MAINDRVCKLSKLDTSFDKTVGERLRTFRNSVMSRDMTSEDRLMSGGPPISNGAHVSSYGH